MADTLTLSTISTQQSSPLTSPLGTSTAWLDADDDESLPGVDEGVRLCYRWMTLPPIRCQNFVIVQWGQETL